MNRFCILFFIFIIHVHVISSKEREHDVQGRVVENFTGENMGSVRMILMTADSVPVDTVLTTDFPTMPEETGKYKFKITHKGKYIIKASLHGYEDSYMNFSLRSDRESFIMVQTIRMAHISNKLSEVTIKASKVKMVISGDTVIYNADAFKVEEGSMLDGLIANLPGCEIDAKGQIFVNGRFVESLLINGRDFFRGNPKVALENLPAYTVHKVKVFERDGAASQLMGRNMNDQHYTMDVRLKKEYSIGYLGNVETGAGSDERYMAKGVGIRFSERDYSMAYGNANNVNDMRKASQRFDGGWDAEQNMPGLFKNKSVGLNLMRFLDSSSGISTNNELSHTDNDLRKISNNQTFLEGGDAFQKITSYQKEKVTKFTSKNNLTLQKRKYFLISDLNITYQDENETGENNSLSSLSDSVILNTLRTQENGKRHFLSTIFNTMGGIRTVCDMIRYSLDADYQKVRYHESSVYDLQYMTQSGKNDFRVNHWNRPNTRFNLKTHVGYDYLGYAFSLSPYYDYSYGYENVRNRLYRLDWIENADSAHLFLLPSSQVLYNSILDENNSESFKEYTNTHKLGVKMEKSLMIQKKEASISINLPLRWVQSDMNYHRNKDYKVKRSDLFFDPSVSFKWQGITNLSLTAKYFSRQPSLPELVDIRDDSNPLRVRTGNTNLKNIHEWDVNMTASRNFSTGEMWNMSLSFTGSDNVIAYSLIYDKQTGVSSIKPVNVDGNWRAESSLGITKPLNKSKNLVLSNTLSPYYRHNVDMTGTEINKESSRSVVKNIGINERLKIDWQLNEKMRFVFNAGINYAHISSKRTDFTKIDACNFHFGGMASINLPWKLSLTTDFTNYFYRGYHDKSMNRSDLVWNAHLSKSLMKGNLLISFDALDIISNLSNIQYNINSQGRVETWTNSIPRYAMVRVAWKFFKNPRKK